MKEIKEGNFRKEEVAKLVSNLQVLHSSFVEEMFSTISRAYALGMEDGFSLSEELKNEK